MRAVSAVILLGGSVLTIFIGAYHLDLKQTVAMAIIFLGMASFVIVVAWLLKNLDDREKEIERREAALKTHTKLPA